MTFDLTSVEVTCVTVRKDHCIQVLWKYIKVCGYSDPFPFFQKTTWTKGHWPLGDLWPQVWWGHMCNSAQGSLCPKSHDKTSKYVDTVTLFFKNLNQRSLISRWPLTPRLLRSHVWLNPPKDIVFKSHGNTLMYVDTVINFAKYHIIRTEWVIT